MSSTTSEPSRTGRPARLARLAIVGVVFVIVLALDLWTKAWAWENLKNGPAVELVEHVFYLKFGFNTGSAFSFLRDASWARHFFIVVTFLALGYMGWLALKMPTERRYGFLAVGLIAAGAAGNLHDRLVRTMDVWMNGQIVERHGVIDFLQFFYNWDEQKYWPIFNVADSALVCGVILLLIFLHYHGAEGELGAPVAASKPGDPVGKPTLKSEA
jgi:signal peptidase II